MLFKSLYHHFPLLMIVLVSFIGLSSAYAGNDNTQNQETMYFKHLTREDGLPSNVVRYIAVDFFGFIWIATDNGLVRFDGKDMKVFRYIPGDSLSLAESSISTLLQTSDSMLWIGTKNGLSVLNPLTQKIENYQRSFVGQNHFPGEWIICFHEDENGIIWIGTNNGIIKADPESMSFQQVKLNQNEIPNHRENLFRWVNNIAEDPRNSTKLFLATRGGLLLFDKIPMSIARDYDQNTDHLYRCAALFIDDEEVLWTGEWDTDLKKLDLKTEKWEIISSDYLPKLNILDIQSINDTELLLGTVLTGLCIFNKKLQSFQFFQHNPNNPKSLISNWIHGNILNHNNEFWVSTNNGISISDPQYRSFRRIYPDLPLSTITSFYQDSFDKRLYITGLHCKGLSFLEEGKQEWGLIFPEKELRHGDLSLYNTFCDSDGTLWINSNKGLLYYNRSNNLISQFYDKNGQPVKGNDTVFLALFEDSRNRLWIGTRFDFVISIDSSRGNVTYHKYDPSFPNSIPASQEFKTIREDTYGKIWFGSYNGIAIYDPNKKHFIHPVNDILPVNGLNNKVIWGIETDTLGRMYFSLDDEGLLRLTEKEPGRYEFKLYHLNHGLNDLNLFGMDRDHEGNIWIINEGITCFNPYEETFKVFDIRNGLHSNKNWSNIIYIDDSGNIYLDAGKAFETINIKDIQTEQEITNLILEYIEINSELLEQSYLSDHIKALVLKPYQNDIVFYYKAICFGDPDQVKYKYMLKGYDIEWNLVGQETTARYTNLPPGNYEFQVSASYRGVWFNQHIDVHLSIKPNFWQTWWFISLSILIIILLFSGSFMLRTRQIKKKERIKSTYQKKMAELEMEALRAQMNPHFIFNSLNSINNFILKNETEQASDFLVKFSRLIRQVLNNSKNKYVTLSDEIKALTLYVELEQLRFAYRFDYEITIDDILDTDLVMVPPLIVQPYVENAIWHGLMHKEGKGTIKLILRREGDTLIFEVIDNGIGREKSKEYRSKYSSEKKSMGISITKNRINILNRLHNLQALTTIIDLYDKNNKATGTCVIVKIPLLTREGINHESTNH